MIDFVIVSADLHPYVLDTQMNRAADGDLWVINFQSAAAIVTIPIPQTQNQMCLTVAQ